MNNRNAFSLLEILLTVGIIGILVGIATPIYTQIRKSAHTKHTTVQLTQYKKALESYKNHYGTYPKCLHKHYETKLASCPLEFYKALSGSNPLPHRMPITGHDVMLNPHRICFHHFASHECQNKPFHIINPAGDANITISLNPLRLSSGNIVVP